MRVIDKDQKVSTSSMPTMLDADEYLVSSAVSNVDPSSEGVPSAVFTIVFVLESADLASRTL